MLHSTLPPFQCWDLHIPVPFIVIKFCDSQREIAVPWHHVFFLNRVRKITIAAAVSVPRLSFASIRQTVPTSILFLRRKSCLVCTYSSNTTSTEICVKPFDGVGGCVEKEDIDHNSYTLFSLFVSNCVSYIRTGHHRQEHPFRQGGQDLRKPTCSMVPDIGAEISISCQLDLFNRVIVDGCWSLIGMCFSLPHSYWEDYTKRIAARSLLNMKVGGIILLSTSPLGRRFWINVRRKKVIKKLKVENNSCLLVHQSSKTDKKM